MEARELGKIDFDISYGNAQKAAELIEMIVFRKGIGDTLAEGIKYAAKKWDMENEENDILKKEDFQKMLLDYYELHSWS